MVWRAFALSGPSSALPPRGTHDASPKAISERTSYYRARLAFHFLPQVIAEYCTALAFGPSPAFLRGSSCSWQARFGFGSDIYHHRAPRGSSKSQFSNHKQILKFNVKKLIIVWNLVIGTWKFRAKHGIRAINTRFPYGFTLAGLA